MRLSARVDYALRAAVALAGYGERWVSAEQIAEDQGIPRKFLESVSLAAVAGDDLPTSVTKLLEDPDAWVIRGN